MTARARVDAELVRRGLARSRRHAAELVASGRVSIDGRTVAKPSVAVAQEAGVAVSPGDPGEAEYASRAGLKLAGALDVLAYGPSAADRGAPAVDGAWCADLGASTGGFTDVLLRRGAEHVVAIDVGHGQLVERLREEARVTVVEGKNVRDLAPADLERAPGLVTGDLSFISLTLVLPAVAAVLAPRGSALLLVKPQFEVGRERLGRGGVVRDPALHAEAVTTVVRAAERSGLRLRAIVPSPLPGPSGNREFFVWLVADAAAPVSDPRDLAGAVAAAVAPDGPGAGGTLAGRGDPGPSDPARRTPGAESYDDRERA
ncbi:TlyA family RNA methyltransferase [Myceligenerans xiligouense]|uniref:23S rRNA (Cytidine1920-2'-O)/16S rRNA (Cytidine1409-2'-O)-methyltransferase n=1 Tax=Myceligenerans xiligouense TaxID=253184 RepID=A0A3N4YMR5_9MICO|nr:TlyA family RNA methyltransferase [Myceligenerans xiligouense]RPF21953.1 23S rRNA (cytidine1920-2'-O)/16S rRNA (cytidine1409-2'-O)-methyltransferase [Myceligenerans xiligouense]